MKLIKTQFICTDCGNDTETHELVEYGSSVESTIEAVLKTIRSIMLGKCIICEHKRLEASKIKFY